MDIKICNLSNIYLRRHCSVACMLIFLPRRKKASFKVYIKVTYKVHIQSPHKQSPYKVHGIYHTTPPTAPTTRTPKFYGPTLPTSPTPNFDLCHSRTHTPTRRTRPHNPRNLADWFYATTLRSLVYQFQICTCVLLMGISKINRRDKMVNT